MQLRIKRILAFMVDYLIILPFLVIPVLIIDIIFDFQIPYIIQHIILHFMVGFKDMYFKNQSIGKKIVGLYIVHTNGTIPNKIILFSRNILLYIWQIDLLFVLLFNKKICDFIFKTKVIECPIDNN